MPLSLFEGVVDIRKGNELLLVRDMKGWSPDNRPLDVASHPVRAAVAMFTAEVLSVVTREGDADEALWGLIIDTITLISSGSSLALANTPVMFLMRLTSVLGIEPDHTQWQKGFGFDLLDGVFRPTRPLHDYWIGPDDIRPVITVAQAAYEYRHTTLVRLTHDERSRMLERLLEYFSLHHYPLNRLRSLDILKTIFAA